MWKRIIGITIVIGVLVGCTSTTRVNPTEVYTESTRESSSIVTPTPIVNETKQPEPTDTQSEAPTSAAAVREPEPSATTVEIPKIKLTSPAFSSGGMIPAKYSRDGEDISIPLIWGEPPGGTQSFVIIMESDPLMDGDARWVHWVLNNVPAELRELPEGLEPDADGRLSDGSQHLENSWQELRYGGPKTQRFETKKYTIMIYALDKYVDPADTEMESKAESWFGSAKDRLLDVIAGHILAEGKLTGKYKPE